VKSARMNDIATTVNCGSNPISATIATGSVASSRLKPRSTTTSGGRIAVMM